MAARTNRWVIVIVSVASVLVLGVVTLFGLGFYLFTSHIDIERDTDEARARESFGDARARLVGQEPLLLVENGDFTVSEPATLQNEGRDTRPVESLRVMFWDADDEVLVNLRVPFWLLRLGDEPNFELGKAVRDAHGSERSLRSDAFDLDLSLADLERHGAGLVIDYERPGEEHILVWTE